MIRFDAINMALRHYLLVFSILLIVTHGSAFNMKYVMNRLNAIEAKFDAENQRRRSEMEALERKFESENHLRRSEKDVLEKKFETENQRRRSETDDLERKFETENQLRRSETDDLDRKFETEKNLSRLEVLELFRIISQLTVDEMHNKTEDVFPDETSTPTQLLTTLSPSLDKYKQSQRVPDHRNFHSYLILGAKLEKQENVNTRTALTNIGEKLEKDYAIFRSSIINEIRNFTHDITKKQNLVVNETMQSLSTLKSDVEASILELSNGLHKVNQTSVERMEHCFNFSRSLSEQTATALSKMIDETRLNQTSFQSDVESSIYKLSNDLQTVSQTTMENFERSYNISYSLTIVTNELLNNLSALQTQSEMSMLSLKSDVETSIRNLSNNLRTVNQNAIKSLERCNNASNSLTIVTNERLNNLSAFVTETQSELRNESRQSLILFKFDVETTIKKLSNDFHTVNITAMENVERCHNVSDSLTIVTNERLNNLSAFVTKAQSGLRNESRMSMISLKSDFKTSIQKLSNDLDTVNQTTMKNVERFDSLSFSNNKYLNNLVAFVTSTQSELRNETRQSLLLFKADVDASIEKLSNGFLTVNVTVIKNVERCKNVSDSLTIVTNKRLNILNASLTTTQSELRNETRQSLISLKSDVETSIQKLLYDIYTVNQTSMENVERFNNVSDSLTIVTNERLNNLSASMTETQLEFRHESRKSLISLKTDVKRSIKELSNDLHTVNFIAMKNVERSYNVIDSLANVTNERFNNLSDFVTKAYSELKNESRLALISFKSDVETSVQKLSNDLHTVNFTAMENIERCHNVSDSLTIVTNTRLKNLSAFVTTTQSELRNETRQSLTSLKSDVATSIHKISYDLHTVNQTGMENVERFNNVSDSLTIATNKLLNNLSASMNEKQLELRNESRQSLISLKTDVERSIKELSNDLYTVNFIAMKNVERSNNFIDSLANVTNERFNNLSAYVTKAYSELKNESRLSLILFKSDVETSIQKLSNDLHTVNFTAMENVERCYNVSDSLTIVTNARLKNLSAFVTTTHTELRNETRQSLISLKSDVEKSIEKLSYDLHTVNQTGMENVESFYNVSDSLTIVTNERLNNLSASMTEIQLELRNESKQSLISLKTDVERSIKELSNDLHTVNFIVERSKNVMDSLANVTNERFNNLSAYVTKAYSELKNESRLTLISFKSDVETSIQKLYNDFYTVNQTAMKNVERSNDVIDSLANVTNERFNNLSAFVTEAYSELKNEFRLALLSFKSDVETSIQKLSNDCYTVNQTAMNNFERYDNVSDFLKIVTYERFNNLSSLITNKQLELSNETRQSLITLKSDVETSIQKHSNEIRTMNQTAMKSLESCNNVSESLKITTTTALSQMRNETRLSLSMFKSDVQASIQELSNELRSLIKTPTSYTIHADSCKNAPKSNCIYNIRYTKSATPLRVYCDQTTDGGGWLVIQRRKDGSVDFYRNWADYKTGFGDIENEFWIGNDNLHALTSSGLNELRIDMEDFEGNKAYAKYSNFKVHPESDLYKLEVSGYSGNSSESLLAHKGMAFSTNDRDNDERSYSCSERNRGGWWYRDCAHTNLNGRYYHDGNSHDDGIFWYWWKKSYYSLKTVEMKIR